MSDSSKVKTSKEFKNCVEWSLFLFIFLFFPERGFLCVIALALELTKVLLPLPTGIKDVYHCPARGS